MQEKKDDVEEAVGIKGWEISLPPLGEGKTLKKIISCLPQQKKRQTRKCMHSPPTKTNSWRCRQTRRELISSPTRRGLQGERGGREGGSWGRSGRIVFYSSSCFFFFFKTHVWLAGLQAPHPSHSRSLPCHSQRHVSLYLPLSLSINLHLPPHHPFLPSSPLTAPSAAACALSAVVGVSHPRGQQAAAEKKCSYLAVNKSRVNSGWRVWSATS